MAYAARSSRTRSTSRLVTGLAACLLGSSCGGGGTEPNGPAVAGTYRLSGTSTQSVTGAPGVRFEGTLTLTQPRLEGGVNLGGTATLTFTGGALGDATYVLTGPVSGYADRFTGVDFGIHQGTATVMSFDSGVPPDNDMSGTYMVGYRMGAAVVADQGTWRATRQ